MIIVDDIPQGCAEWDTLRIANIGASSASLIITTRGEDSKSADKLIKEFADEAIANRKTPKFSSYRMKEGLLYEGKSFKHRNMILSAAHDVQMVKVGLCYKDKRRAFHCSPDGLAVEIEEGFETKDAKPSIQYERLRDYKKKPLKFYMEHMQQVQMSLFVTGYKRWILQSYCMGMNPLTITVYPDLEFHKKLETRLNWFTGTLNNLIAEYRRAA